MELLGLCIVFILLGLTTWMVLGVCSDNRKIARLEASIVIRQQEITQYKEDIAFIKKLAARR